MRVSPNGDDYGMDIIRRIIALENKVSHLEGRHEPKVVHMRPRAPMSLPVDPAAWGGQDVTHLCGILAKQEIVFAEGRRIPPREGFYVTPRDAEDDMA